MKFKYLRTITFPVTWPSHRRVHFVVLRRKHTIEGNSFSPISKSPGSRKRSSYCVHNDYSVDQNTHLTIILNVENQS